MDVLQATLLLCGMILIFTKGLVADLTDKDIESVWHLRKEVRRGDIDLSKPGTCPPEVEVSSQSSSVCSLECLFDLECTGTNRCCSDDCGGTLCVETTEHQVNFTETTPLESVEQTTTPQPLQDHMSSTDITTLPKETTTVRTTERASSTNSNEKTDLFIAGDTVVNITVTANSDLVLRCSVSTTGMEPLLVMWLATSDSGYRTWIVTMTEGKREVSHGGAWLEIFGVDAEDSRSYICLGGHSEGYLTQTFNVTVIENTDELITEAPCAGVFCKNGGTCLTKSPSRHYKCKCAPGFEGEHCETATRSECSNNPCRNGGVCVVKEEVIQCICGPLYTGARCQELVTPKPYPGKVTTVSPAQTTEAMPDICFLPLEKGNCGRKQSKWYYDTETEQCRQFVYTGCQGNANRFRSYDDCQYTCPRLSLYPCTHPIVTGRCKAKIPRWAYSAESRTCNEFVYGGCNPTGNNFLSRDECLEACIEKEATQTPCSCNTPGLNAAFCRSDFVIIGIVRRQVSRHGQLTFLVVELIKLYKGHNLELRRSFFFQDPLLIIKNRSRESKPCQNQCYGDIEDGKKYIFTGILTRGGASSRPTAFMTHRSYLSRANAKRAVKLDSLGVEASCVNRNTMTSERHESGP